MGVEEMTSLKGEVITERKVSKIEKFISTAAHGEELIEYKNM